MFYHTYILKSKKDAKLYTGTARDLRKRLSQHNIGLSTYTNVRGPFCVIYYEACLSEEEIRSRKLFLKSGMSQFYLINRLGAFNF